MITTASRPDLEALCAKWQDTLRLRDWRVEARYASALTGADGRPALGSCSPFVDAKEAQIRILDPRAGGGHHSVEDVLVRELLHLHFAPLAQATPSGTAAQGFAVGAIAGALTAAKNASVRAQLVSTFVGAVNQTARASRMPPKEPTMKTDPAALAEIDRQMGVDRHRGSGAVSRHALTGKFSISNLVPVSPANVSRAQAARFGAPRHARAGQRHALAPKKLEQLRASFEWLAEVSDEEIERLAATLLGASGPGEEETDEDPVAATIPPRQAPMAAQRARGVGVHPVAPHWASLCNRLGIGGAR